MSWIKDNLQKRRERERADQEKRSAMPRLYDQLWQKIIDDINEAIY